MDERKADKGRQNQASRQSAAQGGQTGAGSGKSEGANRRGIGSSQGQDEPSRERGSGERSSGERGSGERPSAGTADIERSEAGADGTGGNVDSMVGDPTGAFKERP
jgi:hypothetical protein